MQQKKEEQKIYLFLKGFKGWLFIQRLKGSKPMEWQENKTKINHSSSLVKSYLSPEANPLLAGYIWTGFSYLPFDSAQCRCCL